MAFPQTTREILVVLHDPIFELPEPPCNNEYGIGIEYGVGIEYGPGNCPTAEDLFLDIDTPARDLIEISLSIEFVVNVAYLNVDNYIIIDLETNEQVGVRKVLRPFDSNVSNRIMLVTDRHVSGRKYSITMQNLTNRNGAILDPTTGSFFARDAKANSMLAVMPTHFNADPQLSTLRHLLQALSESDDKIGSL